MAQLAGVWRKAEPFLHGLHLVPHGPHCLAKVLAITLDRAVLLVELSERAIARLNVEFPGVGQVLSSACMSASKEMSALALFASFLPRSWRSWRCTTSLGLSGCLWHVLHTGLGSNLSLLVALRRQKLLGPLSNLSSGSRSSTASLTRPWLPLFFRRPLLGHSQCDVRSLIALTWTSAGRWMKLSLWSHAGLDFLENALVDFRTLTRLKQI
jgi:hypothetical protein